MKAKELLKILQKHPNMEVVVSLPGFSCRVVEKVEITDADINDEPAISEEEMEKLSFKECMKQAYPATKVIMLY